MPGGQNLFAVLGFGDFSSCDLEVIGGENDVENHDQNYCPKRETDIHKRHDVS